MKNPEKFVLDVFIPGELVDLAIPTAQFAKGSTWYSWFNDRDITKFLEQGVYPNTSNDQLLFFKNIPNHRIVLIMVDKEGRNIGVISLSVSYTHLTLPTILLV